MTLPKRMGYIDIKKSTVFCSKIKIPCLPTCKQKHHDVMSVTGQTAEGLLFSITSFCESLSHILGSAVVITERMMAEFLVQPG